MYVFADPPAVFQRWLAQQAAPAVAPATALARQGEQVFTDGSCASCHTVRGTTATGSVGPDLTHLTTRTTLAALTIPNTRRELAAWITGSQHIKPGNQMPDIQLSGAEERALIAYLTGLK
jgi:cytochrome c oxidase subunit 2